MQDQAWELISAVIWQRLGRYDGSRSSHSILPYTSPKISDPEWIWGAGSFFFLGKKSSLKSYAQRFDFHAQKSDCDCSDTYFLMLEAILKMRYFSTRSRQLMIYCRSKRRCELDLDLYGFVPVFFLLSRAQQYQTFFFSIILTIFLWRLFMAVSNEFIGQTHVTYPFLDSLLLKSPEHLDQWQSKSGSKIIPTRWAPLVVSTFF